LRGIGRSSSTGDAVTHEDERCRSCKKAAYDLRLLELEPSLSVAYAGA
jgi:hypothetical protein